VLLLNAPSKGGGRLIEGGRLKEGGVYKIFRILGGAFKRRFTVTKLKTTKIKSNK